MTNGKKYLDTRPWHIRFSTVLKLACFIMWEVPGLNLGLEVCCSDESVLLYSVSTCWHSTLSASVTNHINLSLITALKLYIQGGARNVIPFYHPIKIVTS